MRLLQLAVILLCAAALAVAADNKNETRTKRQHVPGGHPRRSGHRSPPPYAVQMEPIAHYSQRDPLYIPHADSKSDNFVVGPGSYYPDDSYPQHTHYHPSSSGSSGHGSFYHQGVTEPEPIIEIIIKESNETLPTPVPPTPPPTKKPKKEPIQVFYVKYEKKQEYGEDKPRVVYDKPVPALTPVEEHEDHHEEDSPSYPPAEETEQQYVTEPPPPGPSTTLRTVIHPDSEYYHSGSSGIRVTFGSEQVPPNNHHKRSDKDAPASDDLVKPTPGLTKRQHGPFSPIDPPPPPPRSPAFGQQRIVNSFNGPQQLIGSPPPPVQQSSPPNFNLQPQFHQQGPPPHIRNQFPPNHQRPRERPSITIQGLPEIQQRQPFNSFAPPHRLNVNHPQQGPTPPFSHQNVQNFPQGQQLPNSSPANFNFDPQLHYKQQREQEKQRFFEQQRYQERRQQEQKRLQEQQRIQDQQRQQEQFRILEQQRRKQEHEQQKHRTKQQQNQYQPQHQQQQFPPQQQQQQTPFKFSQPEPQPQPPQLQQQLPIQKPTGGEILKAIPKLEQHYAIRENPLHPGPFPPNPQYTEVSQSSYAQLTVNNQYPNQNQQGPNQKYNQNKQYPQQQQQPSFQNQQQFFLQNLPPPQQQRPAPTEAAPSQQPSIWGRPVFQGKNPNGDQKIYATPATKTENDYKKYSASTPNSIRYALTSPRPSTTIAPRTTTATTPLTTTTTTPSPRNEAKIKANIASLPDEVPDDIREQLLSSGILGNADIQILDYDKVGGINIGDLPPEALANFYGAGGAAATGAASEPVPQIARAKRPKVTDSDEVQVAASSSSSASSYNSLIRGGAEDGDVRSESVNIRPGAVEMKVVRFDPNTAQGQAVADRLIYENATRLSPVALVENGQPNNGQYNRYLPLKVSGASFPIPDVPELAGKKITSVVVLAPVDYGHHNKQQQQQEDEDEEGQLVSHRQNRKIGNDVQAIRFLAGDSLKMLVKKPSVDNYKRWLEQERQTEPQRQSVVLLVTTPYNAIQSESDTEDKEIFMYDVASESVSKLAGDLSTAFVDAAESNSDLEDPMGDPTATTQH